MLNDKSVTFYIKRLSMNNIYCSNNEIRVMLDELTPNEIKLYTHIRDMALNRTPAEMLKNKELASLLELSTQAIAKLKSSMKKKGYLVITFGKDGDGDLTAQVHIGKDQVALYNLGLKVEISDAKQYRELDKKFGFTNPTLDKKQRSEAVKQANEYYLNHK